MKPEEKKLLVAISIIVGTCIGAGVLGIPYIAAQAGFFVTMAYIIIVGAIILLVNMYLGEITLRTKGNHQIVGYADKYLGKKGLVLTQFAFIFGIYSAIIAYLFGVGESLSFLIIGNADKALPLGILFGFFMAALLWGGFKSLKRFEEVGVSAILFLLAIIILMFIRNVDLNNLMQFNLANVFLPFGVVLFALGSFHSVPEVKRVLSSNRTLMKKALFFGTLTPVVFYILFTLVVVGFKGAMTPEIATFALGPIFVILGIFTMFTSYFVLSFALEENLRFDEKMKRKNAWILSAIVPIGLFLIVRFFDYFSFTKILGIGGVVSGGLIGISVLLMNRVAKKKGDRKPEYSVPINWFIIGILGLIFIAGVVVELLKII